MTDSRGVAALERVAATRYVTPLREGGSLPGLVEADDDGIYVLKFRGAGQGVKVLVAEILVTEIARLLGIPVPRLALVTLDAQIAKYEADEEVQDLLNASIGLNLGVDFLPGSFGYDGSVPPPEDVAARIVWLDALTANVDRTWNNPNLLLWHRRTWAIDHGAALYFHHGWPSREPDPVRFAGQRVRRLHPRPARGRRQTRRRSTPSWPRSSPRQCWRRSSTWSPRSGWRPRPWLPDATAVRSAYLEMLIARLANPDGVAPGGGVVIGYQYVTLRCVPRVERGEFVNVGVVLYAQSADFLESAHHVDAVRLRALAPDLDLGTVEDLLGTVQAVCRGDERSWPAAPGGARTAVRLAHRAALDHRPAQPPARRPLRRPGGRAAAADGDARRVVTLTA